MADAMQGSALSQDYSPAQEQPLQTERVLPQKSGPLAVIKDRLRGLTHLRLAKRIVRSALAEPRVEGFAARDIGQKQLIATWKDLHTRGLVLDWPDVGFQNHSEFEEDGHLLYIFSLAGTTNRTLVEISAQDARVCMGTNLVLHHRWRGFFFDGDPVFVDEGRRFFAAHPATQADPPVFESRWFDKDNINEHLRKLDVPPEIDLLSLDIDGVDLHLWQALTVTRPRVLVAEFNNAVPSDRAITVPYRADFDYRKLPPEHHLFRSASLAAYVAASRAKGYRLVAVNSLGFNAIFLRDDVGVGIFPEIPASVIDANPSAQRMRAVHWPVLETLPWVEVG
jgi:hypothetical protein